MGNIKSQQKNNDMPKNIFLDIETTGLDPLKCGIIQISGCIEIDGELTNEFNYHIKPFTDDLISDSALKITNTTLDELRTSKKYRDPKEVHNSIKSLLSLYVDKYNRNDKYHFIGYNSHQFDYPFLRSWFNKCGDNYFGSWFWTQSIDVMLIWAYLLQNERYSMNDFKLSTVAKHIGIDVRDDLFHDSSYDIRITRQMFKEANKRVV
jgi:DNA polymerase-3 subunit epsilon